MLSGLGHGKNAFRMGAQDAHDLGDVFGLLHAHDERGRAGPFRQLRGQDFRAARIMRAVEP